MSPDHREPQPNPTPTPQADVPLSAEEEEALLDEWEAEFARGGPAVDSFVALDSCLTCSIVIVLLIAAVSYIFR